MTFVECVPKDEKFHIAQVVSKGDAQESEWNGIKSLQKKMEFSLYGKTGTYYAKLAKPQGKTLDALKVGDEVAVMYAVYDGTPFPRFIADISDIQVQSALGHKPTEAEAPAAPPPAPTSEINASDLPF